MIKYLLKLMIILMLIMRVSLSYADPGDTCQNAATITSLPYSDVNATLENVSEDGEDYSDCLGDYAFWSISRHGFYKYSNDTNEDILTELCFQNNGIGLLGMGVYEGCPTGG